MTHRVTVESITNLTPDVKQFRLRADDHEFAFDPGQHTAVHVDAADVDADTDGDDEVVRPYTPTNRPGTDELTLAIKRYDDGTLSTYMHDRERGDEVRVEDVDGNLSLRDTDADVAFVATGTGITPMVAMVKQYLDEGTGHAHFFFGETDRDHLIYRETLDQLAAESDRLDVTYVLSAEAWDGPTGHVQEHLTERVENLADRDVYVCGVPEMVVETQDRLQSAGVPAENVFVEGWESDEVSDESDESNESDESDESDE